MSRHYTPPLENITGREEEGLPKGRSIIISIQRKRFLFREVFPGSNMWSFVEEAGNKVHGSPLPLDQAIREAELLVKQYFEKSTEEVFKSLRKTRVVSKILKKFQS